MEEKELAAFIEWLPTQVEEFKDKSAEEIVATLNEVSKTEEGIKTIEELIKQFKGKAGMFKQGGKLNLLVTKFQKGGGVFKLIGAGNKKKEDDRNKKIDNVRDQNVLTKNAKITTSEDFNRDMHNTFNKFSAVSENNIENHQKDILKRVNSSKANFVKRLKNPNRSFILDWSNPDNISTHKLSYATDDTGAIVYPEVAMGFNGKLTDFTNPKIKSKFTTKFPGADIAIMNRDTVRMSPADAEWFTKNYKNHFPNFKK